MDVKVLAADKEAGKQKLPAQFSEPVRGDLIKRAVHAAQANKRQAYGAMPGAGMRQSGTLSRRRRKYRGGYGKGISRVPRKIVLRRGMQMIWTGAIVASTVGGRRAHAPRSEKNWGKNINDKERRKAIRSALSATMNKEVVANRGHKVPEQFPFIADNSIEKVKKTKELQDTFTKMGLDADLARAKPTKVRAGKGKRRGRRYKRATGPLLVVSDACDAINAAKNIPGVQVSVVANLNAELLAPGCAPGRLTIFTQAAIEKIEKEHLFT